MPQRSRSALVCRRRGSFPRSAPAPRASSAAPAQRSLRRRKAGARTVEPPRMVNPAPAEPDSPACSRKGYGSANAASVSVATIATYCLPFRP
jgi:hypothetical protein